MAIIIIIVGAVTPEYLGNPFGYLPPHSDLKWFNCVSCMKLWWCSWDVMLTSVTTPCCWQVGSDSCVLVVVVLFICGACSTYPGVCSQVCTSFALCSWKVSVGLFGWWLVCSSSLYGVAERFLCWPPHQGHHRGSCVVLVVNEKNLDE